MARCLKVQPVQHAGERERRAPARAHRGRDVQLPALVACFEVLEKWVDKTPTGAQKCRGRRGERPQTARQNFPGWEGECTLGAGRKREATLGEAGSGLSTAGSAAERRCG